MVSSNPAVHTVNLVWSMISAQVTALRARVVLLCSEESYLKLDPQHARAGGSRGLGHSMVVDDLMHRMILVRGEGWTG